MRSVEAIWVEQSAKLVPYFAALSPSPGGSNRCRTARSRSRSSPPRRHSARPRRLSSRRGRREASRGNGTWGSLLSQSKKDLYGNASIGNNIRLYDTNNCIIHTTEEKKVVVQGLDGYIVAEHNDTLLICKLSEEQRIKQFSENE